MKIEKFIEYKDMYNGFQFLIMKIPTRDSWASDRSSNDYHYCGYVKINETSKFYGNDYDDVPVECHGGLTYAGDRLNNGDYYIGFDCNHYRDNIKVQDLDFCIKVCKSMIEQLIILEK